MLYLEISSDLSIKEQAVVSRMQTRVRLAVPECGPALLGLNFSMSFRKLEEKTLGEEPTGCLVAWCPTMDLVAFVTGENHIAVHRLSWAKLVTFNTTGSAKISALVWSPDGRAVAAGHDDGNLTIFDVESGESVMSTQAHSFKIACMQWSKLAGDQSNFFLSSRCHNFLPEQPFSAESARSMSKIIERNRSVLITGDTQGTISIRMSGTFLIGTLQCCLSRKKRGVDLTQIKNISLSADLSLLFLVIEDTEKAIAAIQKSQESRRLDISCDLENDDPRHETSDAVGYLVALNSQVLAEKSEQLFQIGSHAWNMECIILNIQAAIEHIRKCWKESWDHMTSKLHAFEELLRAHESNSTVEGELLVCVASGCASPALQSFLTSLREQGIRRWEKVMDTGCTQVQQQITQRIIPAVQSLVFRAGEILGLARWEEEYSSIGLEEATTEDLLVQAEKCICKAAEIQASAQSFHTGILQFCRWLERLTLRVLNDSASTNVSAQDALAVAKFIKIHLGSNNISALLDGIPPQAHKVPLGPEHDGLPILSLSVLDQAGYEVVSASLTSLLRGVKGILGSAFETTQQKVASKIEVAATVKGYARRDNLQCTLCAFEDTPQFASSSPIIGSRLAFSSSTGRLHVLQLSRESSSTNISSAALALSRCALNLEQQSINEIQDLQWYTTSKLAILSCAGPNESIRSTDVDLSVSTGPGRSAEGPDTCEDKPSALTLMGIHDVKWTSCMPNCDLTTASAPYFVPGQETIFFQVCRITTNLRPTGQAYSWYLYLLDILPLFSSFMSVHIH